MDLTVKKAAQRPKKSLDKSNGEDRVDDKMFSVAHNGETCIFQFWDNLIKTSGITTQKYV